jgi:hypothetical protein
MRELPDSGEVTPIGPEDVAVDLGEGIDAYLVGDLGKFRASGHVQGGHSAQRHTECGGSHRKPHSSGLTSEIRISMRRRPQHDVSLVQPPERPRFLDDASRIGVGRPAYGGVVEGADVPGSRGNQESSRSLGHHGSVAVPTEMRDRRLGVAIGGRAEFKPVPGLVRRHLTFDAAVWLTVRRGG